MSSREGQSPRLSKSPRASAVRVSEVSYFLLVQVADKLRITFDKSFPRQVPEPLPGARVEHITRRSRGEAPRHRPRRQASVFPLQLAPSFFAMNLFRLFGMYLPRLTLRLRRG